MAVKVLASHLSGNMAARERFEREARAVAVLKHPNICTLYDIGEDRGVSFLVMEFLEGETLADRLKREPLSLDESLRFGTQLADALDKAHRAGVVHRDFKPGNIIITKLGPKITDYGLAKLQALTRGDADLSALPTAEKPLTEKGAILGTFQYMSPEQLEAKDTDARTDIFAFGAIFYEMLTGRRAFEGESQASLISAIMSGEPRAISELQPMTPPALEHAVKRSLAKDPDERWQSATDIVHQLRWISEGSATQAPATASRRGWRRIVPYAITAIAVALIVALASWSLLRPAPQQPVHLEISPAPAERFTGWRNLTVAPDGRRIVYRGESDGVEQLYVRPLDQTEAAPLSDTEEAWSPFFSPDGQWLGFFSSGDWILRKTRLTGGASVKICDVPNLFWGASWGTDDTIVFSHVKSGLARVSASGGTPEVLTTPDPAEGELRHEYPEILPGGNGILFTIRTGDGPGDTRIAVLKLREGEKEILVEGAAGARFAPTGHVVYGQGGRLMAMPFDLAGLKATGPPVPVLETVTMTMEGLADFDISADGILVFRTGRTQLPRSVPAWVDRQGSVSPLPIPAADYWNPALSPDGGRLALDRTDEGALGLRDIWVYDLDRGGSSRLTLASDEDWGPVWSPDGRFITFGSARSGPDRIYRKRSDGSGAAEPLTAEMRYLLPGSWSPDGKTFVFSEGLPEADLWNLSLDENDRPGTPQPFLETPFTERDATFSPEGRWLAYVSDESGRSEVYVRPFPRGEARWPVSTEGGRSPRWARDTRELFYRNGDKMMVVDYSADGDTFRAETPRELFTVPNLDDSVRDTYDVTRDGRRFLVLLPQETEEAPMRVHVVLNWFQELERLAPAR